MKSRILLIFFLFTAFTCQAKVFIKQSDIDLKGALAAIAKDMQLKLVDDIEEKRLNSLLLKRSQVTVSICWTSYLMYMILIGMYMAGH